VDAATYRPVVLAIIERRGNSLCLDIFRHGDGTYGFQEYRRDAEDLGAWSPQARTAGGVYATRAAALEAAKRVVPRLAEELLAQGNG
jgi:hypothetical protein